MEVTLQLLPQKESRELWTVSTSILKIKILLPWLLDNVQVYASEFRKHFQQVS